MTLTIALALVGSLSAPPTIGLDRAVVEYLRPLLKSVGGAARVNYVGICFGDELELPNVDANPAPPGATGMSAVRQIFQRDPDVTLVRDGSGMLTITIGRFSSSVLQTKVPPVTLDPNEQYTPPSAVDVIGFAMDKYAKERKLNFRAAATIVDVIMSGPAKGAPHLPQTIQNVTVDEALDSVARTFGGVVLYGTCARPDGKELFRADYIYGLDQR